MNKVLIVNDDKTLLDVLRYNLVNDGFTKEFELLTFLMRHRGQVFNREQLIERVTPKEYAVMTAGPWSGV